MEFERSGSIDELLGEVKHLVGLIRLAVETDADLSRDLVPIAWRLDVPISPTRWPSFGTPAFKAVLRRPTVLALVTNPPSEGGALRFLGGQQNQPICGRFFFWREPSDGLEPSTPSLPSTHGNGFRLSEPFWARSDLPPIATGCDR